MKWRMYALSMIAVAILASCKNKSTESTEVNDSLTTNNTNEGMNPSISSIEVPVGIKTTFDEKYPQATNVQWNYYRPVEPYYIDWEWTGWPQMDTLDYITTYRWNDRDYISWYDDQGNWVGTISTVTDHSSLPAPVNAVIQKEYSGYTITSVKMENDKNRTAYEVKLESGSNKGKLLIDENGTILKRKIDTGDRETKEKMNPKEQ